MPSSTLYIYVSMYLSWTNHIFNIIYFDYMINIPRFLLNSKTFLLTFQNFWLPNKSYQHKQNIVLFCYKWSPCYIQLILAQDWKVGLTRRNFCAVFLHHIFTAAIVCQCNFNNCYESTTLFWKLNHMFVKST